MIQGKILFSINLNGQGTPEQELPSHWRLIDYLHEKQGLTGTKLGCGTGFCKACTVSVKMDDGIYQSIPACSTSLDVCNGWDITTIEGLGTPDNLHPLQQTFVDDEVFQCGYCTPGFLMESFTITQNANTKGRALQDVSQEVDYALESHLCRCTGYQRFAQSVKRALSDALPPAVRPPQKINLKWDLIQDLHEAAEIENALMLQYMVAAFSIKVPEYKQLVGFGHRTPGKTHTLLSVAIEEMVHLDLVNRLLVELGGAPNLVRQDMPYEPHYYPFKFELGVLTPKRLAQFIYAESSKDSIDNDKQLKDLLTQLLPEGFEINRVGSLYKRIREKLQALWQDEEPEKWALWDKKLHVLMEEGEHDHYDFFVQVLKGEHFTLKPGIWARNSSQTYPVNAQLVVGTAYDGFPHTFVDTQAKQVAMLANRHHWLTMALFELSYLNDCRYHMMARRHMAGPLLQLCRLLPKEFGVLPPFDKFRMDFNAGKDKKNQLEFIYHLVVLVQDQELQLQGILPHSYLEASKETMLDILRMMESNV